MGGPEDILLSPATELERMLRGRDVSAVELVDLHVARIEARNGELGALVLLRLGEARTEAAAADRALAAGEPVGPLHGIPFTAKDAIAVAGMRRPNGSRLFADDVPDYDAPVIRRMRGAGAILLGKTNVPEFCGFYDTVNDVFGATRNPHDPERSAGGSSGGEAVAVASGMSAIGVGSDLGSSIRNPAHFTGLFGLKPSRELVPCSGHAPEGETPGLRRLAAIGPLVRSAGDLELALDVLAEHPAAAARDGAGAIGVYEDDFLQPVARDCRRAVHLAAGALEAAGHTLVDDRPPRQEEIRALYDWMVATEIAARIAASVRGREAKLSRYGRFVVDAAPREDVPLQRYLDAWACLSAFEREVDEWFERRRLALCPVAPGPAPRIGEGFTEVDGEPVRPGGKLTLCTLANAAGLPSAAVPVLRTGAGLPVGVQVTGARGRDREVIAAARTIEAAYGGFIAPP